MDEGPYKISQPYSSKLHVPFHAYISKSHAQKEKINKKVHELSMEAVLQQGKGSINHAKTQGRNLTECAYKNVPKVSQGETGRSPTEKNT